jgi:hypothetical protein
MLPADMPPAPTLIHVPGEAVLANLPTDSPRKPFTTYILQNQTECKHLAPQIYVDFQKPVIRDLVQHLGLRKPSRIYTVFFLAYHKT